MKAFFSLIAYALLLVSAAVVVLGGINSVFGLHLGIAIGGTGISLLAGIFEFLADPKKLFSWVQRHKVQTAVGLVVLCGLAYMTLFSLMGGAVGMAVESNDVSKIKTLLAEKKYAPEQLNPHLYQALKADPNRVDRLGRSPAMLLVLYRWSSSPKETEADNLILFQKLIEGGTSLSHQENTGKSLLDVAKGQKATAYIDYLERNQTQRD